MISVAAAIVAILKSVAAVNTAVSGRIYAAYAPEDTKGLARIVVDVVGGLSWVAAPVHEIGIRLKIYGGGTLVAAQTIEGLIYDGLHNAAMTTVGTVYVDRFDQDSPGQPLVDPDTHEDMVLANYSAAMA